MIMVFVRAHPGHTQLVGQAPRRKTVSGLYMVWEAKQMEQELNVAENHGGVVVSGGGRFLLREPAGHFGGLGMDVREDIDAGRRVCRAHGPACSSGENRI
ncbi:hypothetical protein ASC93_14715 [Massilia sp. Root335]|nr:hypothetical protein ASC93_14715 [Massilia sp. Root335]